MMEYISDDASRKWHITCLGVGDVRGLVLHRVDIYYLRVSRLDHVYIEVLACGLLFLVPGGRFVASRHYRFHAGLQGTSARLASLKEVLKPSHRPLYPGDQVRPSNRPHLRPSSRLCARHCRHNFPLTLVAHTHQPLAIAPVTPRAPSSKWPPTEMSFPTMSSRSTMLSPSWTLLPASHGPTRAKSI